MERVVKVDIDVEKKGLYRDLGEQVTTVCPFDKSSSLTSAPLWTFNFEGERVHVKRFVLVLD